jgi:hypothetical protein
MKSYTSPAQLATKAYETRFVSTWRERRGRRDAATGVRDVFLMNTYTAAGRTKCAFNGIWCSLAKRENALEGKGKVRLSPHFFN